MIDKAKSFFTGNLYGGVSEAMVAGTSIAWAAGNKLFSMIPESITAPLINKPLKGTEEDFIVNYKGKFLPDVFQGQNIDEFTDFTTGKKITDKQILFNYSQMAGDMFYNMSVNVMWLQVQSSDTWMALPCINGYPKISMKTIPNTMPIASNLVPATTNRRIEPARFLFEFPIAYLGVFGVNDNFAAYRQLMDKRNWLDKAKGGISSAMSFGGNWNPINWVGLKDLSEDDGFMQERGIPTYDQVYSLLEQFPSQFGCYLYMGIQNRKIPCSASIEIESTRNGIDAIFVKFELIECQEFDFEKLKTTKTNRKTTQDTSSSSQGLSVADNTNKLGR